MYVYICSVQDRFLKNNSTRKAIIFILKFDGRIYIFFSQRVPECVFTYVFVATSAFVMGDVTGRTKPSNSTRSACKDSLQCCFSPQTATTRRQKSATMSTTKKFKDYHNKNGIGRQDGQSKWHLAQNGKVVTSAMSSGTWPGTYLCRIFLAVLLLLVFFSHGIEAPCPPGCTCKITNPKNRGQSSRESHPQPALLQPPLPLRPGPGSSGPGGSSKVGVGAGTTAAPKNRTVSHKVSCSENEQPFTDLSEMIKNDLPENVVQL